MVADETPIKHRFSLKDIEAEIGGYIIDISDAAEAVSAEV
jgi:hypothetical protein